MVVQEFSGFMKVPFGRELSWHVPFRQEPERSVLGIVGTHPGSFRMSDKQRGYGIRNSEEDTENQRLECLKVPKVHPGCELRICRLEC